MNTNDEPRSRLVVFTGDLAYSVRRGIRDIDSAVAGLDWLVVVNTPVKPLRQLVRNQRSNLRRNGWRWIPYQVQDALKRLPFHSKATPAATGAPGQEYSSQALASMGNVRVVHVRDIHAESSLQLVRDFGADLGLSLAAPILRPPLFSLPRLGTINLHKGKVPDYRGMPPAFWELWHDERVVGCTVHWVERGLDTGPVVCSDEVDRQRYSTVRGLQIRLDEVGAEMMCQAVAKILRGDSPSRSQPRDAGKTFRKPTLRQQESLARKIEKLQPPSPPLLRRVVKDSLLDIFFRIGKANRNLFAKPRITVLLYHRVSDDARDNLTVGTEQFDRQMALLRKHCTVLTIDEVLAQGAVPRSDRPLVAVTFDDGYLDNYLHAAPILRKNGVPAAFFVSTGIIDRQDQFPHDLRRGNEPLPVMSWDQLRDMHRWGFAIGSHTVNHADCAAESEEVVRDELAVSHARLRDELGIGDVVFAYPYGGRNNMTPERLRLVREAGYKGCLSAYGGSNPGSVDPFNVRRRGIHWEFSDRAFLFECLGLRQ